MNPKNKKLEKLATKMLKKDEYNQKLKNIKGLKSGSLDIIFFNDF